MAARSLRAARAAETPLQTYQVIFMSRGWAIGLMLLWVPMMLAILILVLIYGNHISFPYDTGVKVLGFFALLSTLAIPALVTTSRRTWQLYADRLDIRHRPVVPLLGAYHHGAISFADIAAARLGELLNGQHMFEIETRAGRRYRLTARYIGKGREVRSDHEGFDAFIETIRLTIAASGTPVPEGQPLRVITTGVTGLMILGVISAVTLAGVAAGGVLLLQGEMIGMEIMTFILPLGLLFGGLFLARWRKWRAGG